MVTLETAIAVPVLVAMAAALVWVVSWGATYVRILDAAQTAARQVARGGVPSVPPGVMLDVTVDDGLIRAETRQEVSAPVSILWGGATVTVRAAAVAAPEPGSP